MGRVPHHPRPVHFLKLALPWMGFMGHFSTYILGCRSVAGGSAGSHWRHTSEKSRMNPGC